MSLLKPVSRCSYDSFISLVQQEAAAIVSGLRDFIVAFDFSIFR